MQKLTILDMRPSLGEQGTGRPDHTHCQDPQRRLLLHNADSLQACVLSPFMIEL